MYNQARGSFGEPYFEVEEYSSGGHDIQNVTHDTQSVTHDIQNTHNNQNVTHNTGNVTHNTGNVTNATHNTTNVTPNTTNVTPNTANVTGQSYSYTHPEHMMGSYITQLGTPHLVSSLFLSPPTEESTISTPGTAVVTAPRHSVEMNLRVNNGGGPTPPFLPDYPLYTYDFRYGRAKESEKEGKTGLHDGSNPRHQGGDPRHQGSNPRHEQGHGSGSSHQQCNPSHQQSHPQHQQGNPQHQQGRGSGQSSHQPSHVSPTLAKSSPPRVSPVSQKAGLNVSPTLSSGSPSQLSPSPEEMAYSSSFSAKSENPKRVYKKKTLTAQQKLVHNQIERKYRSAINLGLLRLKSLVPWYQLVEGEQDEDVAIKREEEWNEAGGGGVVAGGSGGGVAGVAGVAGSSGLHPSQDPSGCPYSLDELATLSSKAGILQVSAEYVQYLQAEVARLRAGG